MVTKPEVASDVVTFVVTKQKRNKMVSIHTK